MMKIDHQMLKSALNPKILGLEGHLFQIYTDSRLKIENGLFWALKGEKFDGHDFIIEALENGAKAVLTSQEVDSRWLTQFPNVTFYQVPHSLNALQILAQFKVQKMKNQGTQVVGITGSSGKTTCKEFTYQIASATGIKAHSNKGSFNNHFGVPFNILSADMDSTQALICEMGMNHAGELTELSLIAQPNIVCCTMVGTAHIEHFGSIDKIALAKQEIYEANKEAVGIFNVTNPWTAKMYEQWSGKSILFAEADAPSSHSLNVIPDIRMSATVTPDGLLSVSGFIQGEEGAVKLAIFGKHHVTNVMAAVAINLALGAEPKKIWSVLHKLETPWGRTQLLKTKNGATLLFDAYNANPESMAALLSVTKDYPIKGRKWALLAEMKELGQQKDELHRQLGAQVAKSDLAKVVFIGESCDSFKSGYLIAGGSLKNLVISNTYNESIAIQVGSMLEPEDFVVIKGSRGMQLERFVPFFNPIHFEGKA